MQTTLKSLDAYVVHLEEQEAELLARYRLHQQKTTAAKITLAGMEEWENPDSADERSKLYHAHVKREHIADCKTQRSALEVIASMSHGIVRIGEAADLIIEAGLSKGRKATVMATAHRTMSEDEETWTWIRPGTFQRNEPAEEAHDGDSEQEPRKPIPMDFVPPPPQPIRVPTVAPPVITSSIDGYAIKSS